MKRKLSKSLSIILTMTIVISAIIIAPVTVSAVNTADSIVDIARAEILTIKNIMGIRTHGVLIL